MLKVMKIVIIDDECDMCYLISQWFVFLGFDIEIYVSVEDVLKGLSVDYLGIVVSDIKMFGMDGMQFLKKIKGVDSSLLVIMIMGYGDVLMVVEVMCFGVFDFLEKLFNLDWMIELVKKVINVCCLMFDVCVLWCELFDGIVIMKKLIGFSFVMECLCEDIFDLGQVDGYVLIEGEIGIGKIFVVYVLYVVGVCVFKKFVLLFCVVFDEDVLVCCLFGFSNEDEFIFVIEEVWGGILVFEDIEVLILNL